MSVDRCPATPQIFQILSKINQSYCLTAQDGTASCPIRWNISEKQTPCDALHPGCSFTAITGSKAVSNKERSELLRSKNGPKKTFEVIFRFVFAVLSLPACLEF